MWLLLSIFTVNSGQALLQFDYMTSEMVPDLGPALDTVYVPGRAGAAWTGQELASTRYRILQAIHPDWAVKEEMYGRRASRVQATENKGRFKITSYLHLQLHFQSKKYFKKRIIIYFSIPLEIYPLLAEYIYF